MQTQISINFLKDPASSLNDAKKAVIKREEDNFNVRLEIKAEVKVHKEQISEYSVFKTKNEIPIEGA